jgi:hypothetical protein
MKYEVDTDARELHFPKEGGPAHEVSIASLAHPGYRAILNGEDITDLVNGLPRVPRLEVVHRAWAGAPDKQGTPAFAGDMR